MKAVNPFWVLLVAILATVAALGQGTVPQSSGIDITGAWFNVYQGTDSNATIPLVSLVCDLSGEIHT